MNTSRSIDSHRTKSLFNKHGGINSDLRQMLIKKKEENSNVKLLDREKIIKYLEEHQASPNISRVIQAN